MQRPLIKYCGNRSFDDVSVTTSSRADYIGFVFVPGTKRYVDPHDAAEWLEQAASAKDKKVVGLFVNARVEDILSVLSVVSLDIIQCHGSESAAEVREIAGATGLPVWKAIHHGDGALEGMKTYEGIVSGYVVDSKVKGQWGGTGQSFDWEAIPDYLAEARRQGAKCFIAGGVNEENVEALLRFHPDGVDVSSGIEKEERKDVATIQRLEERMRPGDELSG